MPVKVTIEVNGREIEHVRITNVGPSERSLGVWRYHVARYVPGERTPVREAEVRHNRGDGVAVLTALALAEVTT